MNQATIVQIPDADGVVIAAAGDLALAGMQCNGGDYGRTASLACRVSHQHTAGAKLRRDLCEGLRA
jgi:hypothetical protein